MFKNILIPTDGSGFAETVVGPGIEMAKAMNASITALFVYPHHRISPYGEFGPRDDIVEEQVREVARANATEYLDRIGTAASAAGVPFTPVVLEEDRVWKGVVDAARTNGCDLILMATHDPHGLSGMLLGSDTRKVLDHTKVPVLVFH